MNDYKLKSIEDVIEKKQHNTSDVDELARRLKKIGGISDDLAKLIAETWKNVALAIFVVLGLILVMSQYKSAQIRGGEQAALNLANVQEQYKAMITALESISEPEPADLTVEKKEELKKKKQDDLERARQAFNDNLSLLERYGSGRVYGQLGKLYKAVYLIKDNKAKEAQDLLSKEFTIAKSKLNAAAEGKAIDADVLTSEYANWLYWKTVIMLEPTKQSEIFIGLKSLAYSSQLITAEVVATMLRLATSVEQVDLVLNVAKEIVTKRPWQGDLIKQEFSSLGYKI
ncbi:MAG: hypothetical protein IT292_11160 [Deltaproteobacteria bacterium]|nr:hypothetical protein [Deltaproteobacteria bacterium]